MPQQISAAVKKERTQEMLTLAKNSARDFQQRFMGKTMEVLWEKESGGVWSGLTGNYIKVYIKNMKDLTNRILPVKLVKLYKDGVWGEVLKTG
jgi:threonylcarbamoyladenosine tRNA methylthiotransferase MtaB